MSDTLGFRYFNSVQTLSVESNPCDPWMKIFDVLFDASCNFSLYNEIDLHVPGRWTKDELNLLLHFCCSIAALLLHY
jgi:hypothetical protein